jgi:CPA1 family monovalent cation:H+ antiporter
VIHLDEHAPVWLVVAILAATVVVAIVARRAAIPASVGLVVVGLAVAVLGPDVRVPISPGLLLAIVLPGLVFEAAFRTDLAVLRPAAGAVLFLAIPGVVIVAALVAVVLTLTTALEPAEAFLVGAMVAATDPAAVLSTFRHVPVPPRLATIVEMESLVNDGTGIVLFGLALEVLAGNGSVGGSIVSFVVTVVGGGAIGLAAGWLAARLVRRVEDHLTEVTITVVLAYGAYLAADATGFSGVIATLVAAGAFGAFARHALSPAAVAAIDVVWEFAAFLLTAGVFLIVGLSIAPDALVAAAGAIGWGIVAILVARAAVVYGLLGGGSALGRGLVAQNDTMAGANGDQVRARGMSPGRERGGPDVTIPAAWLHVVFWAGLRGAVSVALALSLPVGLEHRELLQGVTFGIVLFTLFVQGSTAGWVVRRVGATAA